MLLDAIEAVNFRNLSGKIDCAAGINILFGDNGQGKTNWLEAINLLATGRSFRTQKLQETVKFGETLGIVRGIVSQTDSDIHRALQVSIQGNTKSLWVNGKREPISRYLTQLNCFTFTAADLEVVRGGPEARRNFIDHCALNLHPAYARTLSDLHRILKQKNSLLKSAADGSLPTARLASMLAPWNDQLVEVAAEIHATRTDIVRRLGEVLEKNLFGSETVAIRYVSSLEGKGDLSDYKGLLSQRLALRVQAEVVAGHSLVGPQRDDLSIVFNGYDLRSFGSSGQQRSALIILDLAAISLYYSQHNEYPLFLIDDVDAELDRKRISLLLEHLEGRTQTFITTSKESLADQFVKTAKVCRVVAGSVGNSAAGESAGAARL